MRYALAGLLCLAAFLPVHTFCQQSKDSASLAAIPDKMAGQYISSVAAKSDKLSGNIDKQTEKYLAKLQKQEAKMRRKLSKIDSVAANNIFVGSEQKYEQLQNNINNKAQNILKGSGQYIPGLDTASTTLKFLESKTPLGKISANAAQAKAAVAKLHALGDEFNKADNVKDFIRQRKEYLKQRLENYDLGSELKNYNSTAYYYAQQVNEYKAAMDDPDKMQQKALALLEKIPAFENFMQSNSMLAGLFGSPGTSAAGTGSVAGLQTNAQIQSLLASQMQLMGPNGQQAAQSNLGVAQGELTQLRNKLNQYGSTGVDMPPDLKPNTQKTKTFLKRIEYGVNIQSDKAGGYFPASTSFAFTAGYKLDDRNTIGIGASYKMGWGVPIKHIAISNQGIGLRSYIDILLKKGIYATGGYEYNYLRVVGPEPITGMIWQKSGLIGITKAVNIKSQYFKQAKLQLLWDFLSYQQIPKSQPFVFRVGYNF